VPDLEPTLKDTDKKKGKKQKEKEVPPGVIYLSSLPPYLKPSALRNLLEQRGFGPIQRLFLAPASKHKSASKKNSRQLYTEGWIEFASKKTARRCAESLNTQVVGGKKGGFYHDDVWNMKYLRGMRWEELMAGVREEKRETEGRRDEERRTIARETKMFVEGVEEGRRKQGMKKKRELQGERRRRKDQDQDGKGDGTGAGSSKDTRGDAEIKRTWRQIEVKGQGGRSTETRPDGGISDEVKQVLGKIF
jgi:ESF2/ABP1 family protein